jgi:hypothetical protein
VAGPCSNLSSPVLEALTLVSVLSKGGGSRTFVKFLCIELFRFSEGSDLSEWKSMSNDRKVGISCVARHCGSALKCSARIQGARCLCVPYYALEVAGVVSECSEGERRALSHRRDSGDSIPRQCCVPTSQSFVRCRVVDPGEVAELSLKFGLNVHGRLIVRGHTVSLDGPEKMRADADGRPHPAGLGHRTLRSTGSC